MKKVAIICRTKNRTIMLKRAIEDVLEQVYQDWLLVIINDGGDPVEVDEMVAKYSNDLGDRVLVIHHEKSKGMEAASNAGIKGSESEYVVIHDDDDSWDPLFLQKTVESMEGPKADPKFAGVITRTIIVRERVEDDEIIIEEKLDFNSSITDITIFKMMVMNMFPPISFLYKRSVYDKIGYYREDLPVLGDWDFNLRFIREFDIRVLGDALANYHQRLTVMSGAFSNSVVGENTTHLMYNGVIRNEYLRKDLDDGVFGMGMLMTVSPLIDTIMRYLDRARRMKDMSVEKITGSGLFRLAKKGSSIFRGF